MTLCMPMIKYINAYNMAYLVVHEKDQQCNEYRGDMVVTGVWLDMI